MTAAVLSVRALTRRFGGVTAVSELDLDVNPGEVLGVIGPNGAGKSTLLSLVTGLCPADEGQVTVNGRVAALLELGAGFHPDLTGAENVRINCALLGFSSRQTRDAFPRVVEFAEIGDFISEPLRTYSAGMIMRLAFSVAVCVDPDILIVDEVLAVGDQAFQAKCLDKIFDFKTAGKTILCVSHNSPLIEKFCDRAIWLDHGHVMMDGPVSKVLQAYTHPRDLKAAQALS